MGLEVSAVRELRVGVEIAEVLYGNRFDTGGLQLGRNLGSGARLVSMPRRRGR